MQIAKALKDCQVVSLFAQLKSVRAKAAQRLLMKSNPNKFKHTFNGQSVNFTSVRIVFDRALHSELFSEILSRVSSWNELSRVEMRWVERHFFVIFGKRLVPTRSDPNFCEKTHLSRKLGSEQVFASRDEFGKSSKNSFRP